MYIAKHGAYESLEKKVDGKVVRKISVEKLDALLEWYEAQGPDGQRAIIQEGRKLLRDRTPQSPNPAAPSSKVSNLVPPSP